MSSNQADAPLVPAVFPNRDAAAAAVEQLVRAGIPKDDIGVVEVAREPNHIRDESAHDSLQGALRGAAIGGRLGMLGGIGLVAIMLGPLSVGGLFLAGAGGLLWGGTVGGLVGVVTRVRRRPDVDQWCELELDNQSVLLAVRVRDWSHEPEIAALMTQAGAVSILDHPELDHTWRELESEHPSGQRGPVANNAT